MADRGYESEEDMIKCLEEGIIPHVITDDGKDGYELEIAYEESRVNVKSTESEELKKALHAGTIPDAYKDVISDIKVAEVRRKVSDEPVTDNKGTPVYGTPDEMMARAKKGYFSGILNAIWCIVQMVRFCGKSASKEMEISVMPIKTHAATARIEISAIKERMNGKRSTSLRIV